MSRLMIDGQIAVDFIGRFEHLQADVEHVCDILNVTSMRLPHVFASKHKHYTEYYSPETKAIVSELYAQDIETFGYQFGVSEPVRQSVSIALVETESDPINTVRTFWSGPPMSIYEKISLLSLVKQGHRVEVYSYGVIPKIEGVLWRDAAEIMPETEVFRCRSEPGKGSLAAFANWFRYQLLYDKGGIWADLDVFCFKSFHDLPEACVGMESSEQANNAVLRFPARHPMIKELLDIAKALGKDGHWMDTGPLLVTSLLPKWREHIVVLPETAFYPLPWQDAWKPFVSESRVDCEIAVKDSYCFHWWNEILRRMNISKKHLPAEGSFFYQLAHDVLGPETSALYRSDEFKSLIDNWLQEETRSQEQAKEWMNRFLLWFPFAKGYPDQTLEVDPDERPLKRRLIIWPAMLLGDQGRNINGPSLIRVPDWIPNPLGRYYLYFAHHKGRFIRLAYADHVAGPWTIYAPGSLHLEQAPCLQQVQDDTFDAHIASPDVHVDHVNQQIRMYFHGALPQCKTQESTESLVQGSFVSVSSDGLNFKVSPEVLGKPYFRVFEWQGKFYALSMPGQFYRSQDGLSDFEPGPSPFPANMRHSAVHVEGNKLLVLYSCIGDNPESLLYSSVDLRQPFENWKPSAPVSALSPQTHWEGVRMPSQASQRGPVYMPVRQLRDPAFFAEDDRIYVIYSVAGEWGLAISELALKTKKAKSTKNTM